MLGSGSHQPPRDERVLAAALVALYPFALQGREATTEELADWDLLRERYLGLGRCRRSPLT